MELIAMAAARYRGKHLQLRAQLAPSVAEGRAYCAEVRCLYPSRWIRPGSRWDLAHDRINGGYRGPAHARCNRSEAATYRNRLYGYRGKRRSMPRPRSSASWSSRNW